MLAPSAVAGCDIMDAGEELEIVQGDLLGLDTEFVLEFTLRGGAGTYVCVSDENAIT